MVRASSLWKGEPCEESVFSVRQNVICFCCVSVRGVNLGSLGLLSLVRLFRWHVTQGHGLGGTSFRFGRNGYLFPLVPSCFRQDSVSLAVYSSRPVQASSSRSSTSSKPSLPS